MSLVERAPRAASATFAPARPRWTALALATGLALGGTAMATPVGAVGKGPNHNPRSTVNTSILATHAELVAQLQKEDARQDALAHPPPALEEARAIVSRAGEELDPVPDVDDLEPEEFPNDIGRRWPANIRAVRLDPADVDPQDVAWRPRPQGRQGYELALVNPQGVVIGTGVGLLSYLECLEVDVVDEIIELAVELETGGYVRRWADWQAEAARPPM